MGNTIKPSYRFTYEEDWRYAPLAFWVHMPVKGSVTMFEPPAPEPVLHRGYVFLRVEFDEHELVFSSPAQLEHFVEVLSTRPLPTSRQLSSRRGLPVGPNGHWLSRLPAALKSPRKRDKLVQVLQTVRASVVGSGLSLSFQMPKQQ